MFTEEFGVIPEKNAITFANNDINFKDKTGIDHDKFSFGLKKSLFNFMHGICLDYPLKDWFDFKIPKTKIVPNYIVKCLENADHLGIQLVIDYAMQRSWKCDRGTWQPLPSVEQGDWYHIEIDPHVANDPIIAKQRWQAVFGVSPQVAPQSV
jgi:predicted NUDIX family NTP pyrophosphohydrolase